MLYKNEKELSAELKKGIFQRVYLLYGKDDYLKEQYCRLIVDKVVNPAYRTFNYETFDGKKLSFDQLYDSVLALPFMGGGRCILIDDMDVEKLSVGDSKKLLQILEEVEEGTVVLFLIRQPFLPKKSAKCRTFQQNLEKLGGVICLDERTNSDLVKLLMSRCEKNGTALEKEDARFLIERTTRELMPLYSEVDKLIAYAGGKPITREMILQVTAPTVEGETYDLSKAILAGNYRGAMELLDHLYYLRVAEGTILYALSGAFVDLYRGKVARHTGMESGQVAKDFGYRSNLEFRVKNAMRDSSRYSLSFLKSSLETLAEADYQLKSSRTPGRIILEQAITAIFMALQKEGRH